MARKINFEESGTFNQPEEKPKKTKEEEDNSVNDIFSDADRIIEGQNNASVISYKSKRKKKNFIRGLVIALIISIILAIVVLVGAGIYAINSFRDNFTTQLISSFSAARDDVNNNATLDESESGKMTKKIMNLLSDDDIRYIVNHMTSPEDIQKILNLKGDPDLLTLIPENKREAYKELLEEYKLKKNIIEKELMEHREQETVPTQESIGETTNPTIPEPTTEISKSK